MRTEITLILDDSLNIQRFHEICMRAEQHKHQRIENECLCLRETISRSCPIK